MQEVMQLMLMRTNLKAKQEAKVTIKINIQEETKDPNQMRGKNCPVEYAKSLHIQVYLGVQTTNNTYQASQMVQGVFPRKYENIA